MSRSITQSRGSAFAIASPEQPNESGRSSRPLSRTPHPVYWVIATALVIIAACLALRPGGIPLHAAALGQPVSSGGARGIFAFAGPLSKGSQGVFMVDVDAMTLWAYEFQPQKGCLRLAAARTWRYDRYLEAHNLCDLPPEVVEELVEQQRQYRLNTSENRGP